MIIRLWKTKSETRLLRLRLRLRPLSPTTTHALGMIYFDTLNLRQILI